VVSGAQSELNRNTIIGVVGAVGVPGRYGGFETLAEQLARRITPSMARLVLYCQRSAYPEMRGQADTRFFGHRRVFMPLRANGPASLLHDALAMLHAALVARVDAMLVLGYSGAWALPLVRFLRPHMLIVTNIDGMEWRRDKFGPRAKRVLRWVEDCAVRFSHRIIADNAALVPLVQSIHPGLHPLLIAYGGDHTMVPPAVSPVPAMPPYYLSIARIEPENNCEMILKAFDVEPSRRLVFVGNWNASAYGRDLKAHYAQRPHMYLLDPVYDLSVLAGLRAGACGYVHGHSVGGTNPSLVEALFHTSRILAFDCSFNRSTLGGQGAYFADEETLGNLLRTDVTLDMAPSVMQTLHRRYGWDNIVEAYLNACSVYKDKKVDLSDSCDVFYMSAGGKIGHSAPCERSAVEQK